MQIRRMPGMQLSDERLRIFVYDWLMERGTMPAVAEIAEPFGESPEAVRARLAGLRIGKTILVHPTTGELWMAGPFTGAKTDFTLTDGKRTWFANCAWDMFGVAMLVGRPLAASATCADCGEGVTIECTPEHPPESDALVYFLLPARQWY